MSPRALIATLAVLAASLLQGCGGHGAVVMKGKVISGDISYIAAVGETDPRLKQNGLEGAEVSVRGVGMRADRILSDAKSGKGGDLSIKIVDQDALLRPAEFRVHLPGYADAFQELPLPSPEPRLLVILKPMSPAAGPHGDPSAPKR